MFTLVERLELSICRLNWACHNYTSHDLRATALPVRMRSSAMEETGGFRRRLFLCSLSVVWYFCLTADWHASVPLRLVPPQTQFRHQSVGSCRAVWWCVKSSIGRYHCQCAFQIVIAMLIDFKQLDHAREVKWTLQPAADVLHCCLIY